MQKITEGLKPRQVIEIILKRRWFIIIPFCLSTMVGIYLLVTLPRIYYAETTILIQPQKVPDNYVKSIVSTDINARISAIGRQIMSSTNIEKFIDKFNLFSGPEYEHMYLEEKIHDLQKRIYVEVKKSGIREKAYAFGIGFEGKDPENVMKMANALATYFVDENLKIREAESVGTNVFIDSEREAMGKKLKELEAKVRTYRIKHMGELPEQLETNLRILDGLHKNMSDVTNRLFLIQSGKTEGNDLEKLKENLTNLKSRYTNQHPDVVRLTKQIAELERLNKILDTSTWQQGQREEEVASLEMNIATIENKIKIYQNRVENTPKREQELSNLMRDYNTIERAYNSLMNRRLDAEIALSLERKQKGEQFQVLDPARVPQKPISPNGKKMFLIVLATGLGIGGGLVFLLEYFNTSFKSPEDIESYLGVPVFTTIPTIYHPKDKIKHKINQVSSIFSIIVSSVLLAAFALLSFNGVEKSMELIYKFITI